MPQWMSPHDDTMGRLMEAIASTTVCVIHCGSCGESEWSHGLTEGRFARQLIGSGWRYGDKNVLCPKCAPPQTARR